MKRALFLSIPLLLASLVAASAEPGTVVAMDHGPGIFHKVVTEVDYAARDGDQWRWHVDGWIGSDVERVWIRSAGKIEDGDVEKAELQLLYGRNVHPFWDVLVGVRQDLEPDSKTWAAAGVTGLAPYFFESDVTAFLSTDGDAALRIEQSVDIPLTQKLIAEPYIEVNAYAQDMPERGIGAGFSDVELGLKLRYEITRKFAPYAALTWERALGETASQARAAGESTDEAALRIGIRFWF
ncbi:copper resistance protein B [Parvibaculum sp.]|uniref:copper resistance protein B n=1 Tax=Parvibaculum sp. TaxID=2024848 RepID=UPI00391CB01E